MHLLISSAEFVGTSKFYALFQAYDPQIRTDLSLLLSKYIRE